MRYRRASTWAAFSIVAGLVSLGAAAQVPPEVTNVEFVIGDGLTWDAAANAERYHVYRGDLAELTEGTPPRCHGFDIDGTSWASAAAPDSGDAFAYLVTAESASGEGPAGSDSSSNPRPVLGRCAPTMRLHVQQRVGYGEDAWTAQRIDVLGLDGYVTEQLDPSSIDEASNTELTNRLQPFDPPAEIVDLVARQVVLSVYARRQLEQQAATFWTNHFNTFWSKLADIFTGVYPDCNSGLPQCDPNFPAVAYSVATLAQHRELEDFRFLAFNGNFREMLEASATSPAMILYLDTFANVAGAPNENYSRELLELYAMGVAGGYTQQDVEELARALTGWTICKKKLGMLDDPLAPCIGDYWLPDPSGEWTAVFASFNHDCGSKILFAGTPHQAVIPDTCASPLDGVQDLDLALDAIVAHPSTARFISRKVLERFVTDSPTEAMIDELVAVWNDPSNPQGVGDLRAVLQAALGLDAFLDPDRVRDKIKTPLEHFASAIRAVRGRTDGVGFVIQYLVNAQHVPHFNPVPVGYPERGGAWVDTTNTLERQNFVLYLTALDLMPPGDDTDFGSNIVAVLQDRQVDTAPGNSVAIVDELAEMFFAGALTPAERQRAIEFLETDIDGTPSPYDDTRIRRLAGFLLGHAQFQEQ